MGQQASVQTSSHPDQGWLVLDAAGVLNGLADGGVVLVAVGNVLHMPAEGLISLADILCEGKVGVAINGDLVVIIDGDQLAQAPVTCQGGTLVGDALHVAAISEDAPSAPQGPGCQIVIWMQLACGSHLSRIQHLHNQAQSAKI